MPQGIPKGHNLIRSFLPCLQRLWYISRESELIKFMSFEGSRACHIEGIILLIGPRVKAWWKGSCKSLVEGPVSLKECMSLAEPLFH